MSNFLDRVLESFATTGTGTINLAGAATGFRTFVAGLGGSGVSFYFAFGDPAGADAANWEFGYGTVTDASPDTITRALLKSSSGSLISWAAGTKYIMNTIPADVLMGWCRPARATTRPGWLPAGAFWIDTDSGPPLSVCYFDGTDDLLVGWVDESNNAYHAYIAESADAALIADLFAI